MTVSTRTDVRQSIVDTLRRIAPEIAADALDGRKPLRDQVDLDSMDWLNFLVGLHTKLGIDIPESDYAKLVTLDDLVAYAKTKLGHA
ncbi:MAG TPA: acyl carrier protein [Casimicrobiaceae bacterium]|jgi:acyl carrier protein|nr:acyl carrier protein [Casimicrobiaceae bacterium]